MGHEASQFAPLDPDLEAENELVYLIPILLEAITHPEPQPQSTSILTGRLRVEELLAGNVHTFRTVARMDKQTFSRLVNLMRGAGLDDTPHISVETAGFEENERGPIITLLLKVRKITIRS